MQFISTISFKLRFDFNPNTQINLLGEVFKDNWNPGCYCGPGFAIGIAAIADDGSRQFPDQIIFRERTPANR